MKWCNFAFGEGKELQDRGGLLNKKKYTFVNCRNAASELASQMNSLSFCIAREDARMRHASSRLHSDKVFRADRLLIGWICQLWCAPRFRVERAHPRLSAQRSTARQAGSACAEECRLVHVVTPQLLSSTWRVPWAAQKQSRFALADAWLVRGSAKHFEVRATGEVIVVDAGRRIAQFEI